MKLRLGLLVASLAVSGAAIAGLGATGCSGQVDADQLESEDVVSADDSWVSARPFLYLRCNSTSWSPDAKSYLAPTANPDVYELEFDVTEPWMLTEGSHCSVTETGEKYGWGSWNNFYGAYSSPFIAPGVSKLYDSTTGAPAERPVIIDPNRPSQQVLFRVRFPKLGRFRATLSVSTSALNIAAVGEVQRGGVVWASAGTPVIGAPISVNGEQLTAIYRLHFTQLPSGGGQYLLARVDPRTGSDVWTRTSPKIISLYPSCAQSGQLVYLEGTQLVAVGPVRGEELWRTDPGLDFSISNPACPTNSSSVFGFSGTATNLRVNSINRSDGRVRWFVNTNGWVQYRGVTAGNAIIEFIQNVGGGSTYRAYEADGASDQLRWSVSETGFPLASLPGNDELYVENEQRIRRINPISGAVQWARGLDRTAREFPQFQGRDLYLLRPNQVIKLATASGASRWTYQVPQTVPDKRDPNKTVPSPFAGLQAWGYPLPSGRVVIVPTYNSTSSRTPLALLREESRPDGSFGVQTLFIEEYPAFSLPFEDKSGQLHVVTPTTLRFIDQFNGAVNWTYTPPHTGSGAPGAPAIADVDWRGVYVTYAETGNLDCSRTGLSLLNVPARTVTWNRVDADQLETVTADSERLIMRAGCTSPYRVKAIAK
jgi:hypothetical protein